MDVRPATLNDLLWEFALAETQNDVRHDRMYSQGLGPDLFYRVRTNQREELKHADWELLRSTVLATRPDYLPPILSLELSWNTGWIETRELGELKTPGLNMFRPLAPSRRLAEFVASLENERLVSGLAVEENFRRIRSTFNPSRMLGAPVVIGERSTGPFTIVEGMTRLSVLCSKVRHAEPVPPGIRLVVGLGNRAKEWPFY